MTVQLTIRDVPTEVRDELKARAAARRMSMQEYLLHELERLVQLPSRETVLARIEARTRGSDVVLDHDELIRLRDLDRT